MSAKKYGAGHFLRNQTIAASFLAIELLAALHIGFGNILAWLLLVVAGWNLALILICVVGTAAIAAESLNAKEPQP